MGSPLLETLMADIKAAMKAQDQKKLTTLRMLHSQVKDASVNVGKEPTDELVAGVVAKAIKQRADSVAQYRAGNREDLAAQEEQEAAWLKLYQPKQMTAEEVEALVRQVITATGAASKKEIGLVMKQLMPLVKGRADGKLVNETVQRLLP